MNGTRSFMLSYEAISWPVPSMFCRTLMRTFSYLSPSIRSSPSLPVMISLPSPPRMMLPEPNEVTPLQEVLQTVDQGDVGKHAPPGGNIGDDIGGLIVSNQDVVESRSRQAFHLGKAVEDRIGRLAHRLNGAGRERRAVRRSEDGQPHVDSDAEQVVLVRGPVEPGHAVHFVLGAAADEDVVAALTDHLVDALAADEDVVAGNGVEQ